MHTQRVLIVGYGFIGQAIAEAACEQGFDVHVLTRSRPKKRIARPVKLTIGNAADTDLVLRSAQGVDHVVFSAGSSIPAAAEADPAADMAQSLVPLLNVIDVCRRTGSRLTLLSSGGTVYGHAAALPISEDHPTNPVGAYGIRNLALEKHAIMHAGNWDVGIRVLRIANVYGAHQPLRPQGVVAALLHKFSCGEPLVIYGDGRTIRDYVHISDMADAAVRLLNAAPEPIIVNIGSGQGHSILDLISICETVTRKKLPMVFEQARSFDVRANILDISRLQSLIPFYPVGVEAGIRQAAEEKFGLPPKITVKTAHDELRPQRALAAGEYRA